MSNDRIRTNDPIHLSLPQLMRERNLSILKLSGLTGVDETTIRNQLRQKYKPSLSTLEKLASGLGISIEYFLEFRLEMEERSRHFRYVSFDPLPKALSDAMMASGIGGAELARRTGRCRIKIQQYKSGNRNPRMPGTVESLARGLGLHPEYFLEYREYLLSLDIGRYESAKPFPEALSTLIKSKRLTIGRAATKTGISRSTMSGYVSGRCPVTNDAILRISEGLNVLPSYFAEYRALERFERTLKRVRAGGATLKDISEVMGKSPSAVFKYCTGENRPKAKEVLEQLAKLKGLEEELSKKRKT